jgi:hypothetical protein
MKIIGFCCALLLSLSSNAITEPIRTIRVRPSDGTVSLVKAFDVPAGTRIAGVTFANNDPGTTFPQVQLLRGVTSALGGGELLRTATLVRESGPGTVTVLWDSPVEVTTPEAFHVAVRLPVHAGSVSDGVGPGLRANDLSAPAGSFLAQGLDGEFLPIRADLVMSLITTESAAAPELDFAPSKTVDLRVSGGRSTRVVFSQETPGLSTITIHDVAGRRVATLWDGWLSEGRHDFTCARCDGGIPRGIYFVTARTKNETVSKKLALTHR